MSRVPGFYDDVVELTAADRETLKSTDIPPERLMRETGIPAVWGEEGLHPARTRGRPPDAGNQRFAQRLDRRRLEDGAASQGHG